MKKYILLVAVITIISACELELKPESSLTYNGFWDTEEAAQAAHIGIYASLRGYNYTFWSMGELRSDIWGGATIESPSGTSLIDNDISTTSVPFGNWASFYGLLHKVNDFLKNAPNVTFGSEAEKNHLLGQVYGIRAFIYYTMVKAWGDVPITTEPLLEVDLLKLKKARSSKNEVMTLIKEDIEKSLEYFGSDNSLWLDKKIYWSKSATLALKGDAYLWSGKVLGGGSTDFQAAKTALQQVSDFELVSYDALWGQANENNNEFIFTVDYQQDQASNFYGSFTARAVDVANLFDSEGNPMSEVVVNGASRFGPSAKTLQMLDDTNDARRATFIRMFNDNTGHIPFTEEGYMGAILAKYLGIVDSDGSRKSYNNTPLYRYADVLLLLAEAKNNLGEDPATEINAVRKRAYGEHFETYKFTNGTQAENAQTILNERMKEFVGEGKRWWDLVRAGGTYVFDEIETLSESESYKIYYPISQTMLANDSELTQTEGYTD